MGVVHGVPTLCTHRSLFWTFFMPPSVSTIKGRPWKNRPSTGLAPSHMPQCGALLHPVRVWKTSSGTMYTLQQSVQVICRLNDNSTLQCQLSATIFHATPFVRLNGTGEPNTKHAASDATRPHGSFLIVIPFKKILTRARLDFGNRSLFVGNLSAVTTKQEVEPICLVVGRLLPRFQRVRYTSTSTSPWRSFSLAGECGHNTEHPGSLLSLSPGSLSCSAWLVPCVWVGPFHLVLAQQPQQQ